MPTAHENLPVKALRGKLAANGADPETLGVFDAVVSRRAFGKAGALAALAGLGAGIGAALGGLFGRGLVPVAWAQEAAKPEEIPGKPGITVLTPQPVNAEVPPHLLDDDVTPVEHHFVRNHGSVPSRAAKQDPQGWTLTVDGEVKDPLKLTLDDLKQMPAVTMPVVIECAGDGRGLIDPPVRGVPWRFGAVGCAEWTGARLRDILQKAGLKDTAKYTAHYSEDPQLGQAPPFSRGVPLSKAMDENTILGYRMNGKDLPALHGYPLRLVVPGWIASCSQKWLNRIWIRDRVHDSDKMTGYAYRVPATPPKPGVMPPESDMEIATFLKVKSIVTRPAPDAALRVGEKVRLSGHAWAGEDRVAGVRVSTDYGIRWSEARLTPPPARYAWCRWEAETTFAGKGYYEVWAQAVNDRGDAQPFRSIWSPQGYLNNLIHRVPVQVEG